jgi:hypothetical protein
MCNNRDLLLPGKRVFSADRMFGGSKSRRFHPSSGKKSSAARKIAILSRRMSRVFDPGAASKGM